MKRRRATATIATMLLPGSGHGGWLAPAAATQGRTTLSPRPLPRPAATFEAGVAGQVDITHWINGFAPGVTHLRLRANPRPPAAGTTPPFVPLSSQCPEFRLDGSKLIYDGGTAGSVSSSGSSARLQLEASEGGFDEPRGTATSPIAIIQVDAPSAAICHGLLRWSSFQDLVRDVMGTASPGSEPRGRTDLIGKTFEITPGMLSENGVRGPGPVMTIPFPCTLRAMDARRRPVLRSVSGERDIVQILAQSMPPIDGAVVLQDLVIRDNRAWYDSGEAGVRIKDRFAGRSVRIERCEFVRCQNAVAGGSPGQSLHIVDCRIIDCGLGGQAHGVYVQPGWLEFSGNLVMHSPGARLANGHLLKCRALNARIAGNRFAMNDCPGSYLIDLPNGGDVEVVGNWLEFGPASDNSFATLIAYAAEGAAGDHGGRAPQFAPGRRFRLVVRNNTMVSDFPGPTHFVSLHQHVHPHADGGTTNTSPAPLLVADNLWYRRGPGALVLRRDRSQPQAHPLDLSNEHGGNPQLSRRPIVRGLEATKSGATPNSLGPLESLRFAGHTSLGTGSRMHRFETAGAN